MENNNPPVIVRTNENNQSLLVDQYKILVDSLNKINDIRESSNNFWLGVNGVGISLLAYLRNTPHKPFLLGIFIILGIVFCLLWISYLRTIKKSVETRSELLVKLEKNFPMPVFSKVFSLSEEKVVGKAALTVKEMFVPLLFLGGYLFFAILFFLFPQETISIISNNLPKP